jgi:hypothetical protein
LKSEIKKKNQFNKKKRSKLNLDLMMKLKINQNFTKEPIKKLEKK